MNISSPPKHFNCKCQLEGTKMTKVTIVDILARHKGLGFDILFKSFSEHYIIVDVVLKEQAEVSMYDFVISNGEAMVDVIERFLRKREELSIRVLSRVDILEAMGIDSSWTSSTSSKIETYRSTFDKSNMQEIEKPKQPTKDKKYKRELEF